MQARKFNVAPAFIANAVANILNGAITSLAGPVGWTATQPLLYVTRIRVVNVSASAVTFTLYKGATGGSAAGTQVIGGSKTIAANDAFEWYGVIELTSTQFLTGVASAASALVHDISGEVTFA